MGKSDQNKFRSAKQEWATPRAMFAALDAEFHFTLDVAADASNAKCARFLSVAEDALTRSWAGEVCWCNPPYGEAGKKNLATWVWYAWQQSLMNHATVVMLIPARTNTKWFHAVAMQAHELRFVLGRPKFGDAPHGLPQPLVLVIFRPGPRPLLYQGKQPIPTPIITTFKDPT